MNGVKCNYFDWIDPEIERSYAYYKTILNEMRRDANGDVHCCSAKMEAEIEDMQIIMMEEQQLFPTHVLKLTKQGEKVYLKIKLEILFGFACGCGFMMMVNSFM